jgi:hypothetical protein
MITANEVQTALTQHKTKAAAARALGIPRETLRGILARSVDREKIGVPPQVDVPAQGFVVKRNAVAYDAEGKLTGQWISTAAGPGGTYETPKGHLVKGESTLLDPNGKVLARWIKTREGAVGNGLIEALQSAFEKYEGSAPLVPEPEHTMERTHTIYPLADLHVGMYSWGRETGEAYDVEIATERARAAYRRLVLMAPPSRTATLLNLGDFFHANDAKFVTPGHGHQLDVDGRHPRVLEAGAEIMLEIVSLLLQKHETVEVVCLPGNHDPDAAAALRVALRLYYRSHGRVKVYNEPGIAWYKMFGKNLLGATHGHTVKPADMASMMACDRPQEWGLTEYRSFFSGHIHHERAVEKAGVRVESFQTLASRDAYATNGGWRSGHSVQAITYDLNEGEISRSRVNVLARSHKKIAA